MTTRLDALLGGGRNIFFLFSVVFVRNIAETIANEQLMNHGEEGDGDATTRKSQVLGLGGGGVGGTATQSSPNHAFSSSAPRVPMRRPPPTPPHYFAPKRRKGEAGRRRGAGFLGAGGEIPRVLFRPPSRPLASWAMGIGLLLFLWLACPLSTVGPQDDDDGDTAARKEEDGGGGGAGGGKRATAGRERQHQQQDKQGGGGGGRSPTGQPVLRRTGPECGERERKGKRDEWSSPVMDNYQISLFFVEGNYSCSNKKHRSSSATSMEARLTSPSFEGYLLSVPAISPPFPSLSVAGTHTQVTAC